MRNRFKGLDLIDRVPDELWTEVHDTVQEIGIKIIPKKKKCKKAKWLSEEALQIAVKRREAKSTGEKERYKHLNAEFQRIARRDKKALLSDQCKEIEENKEWKRLEISRKSAVPREYFMQDGLDKGQKWYGPNKQQILKRDGKNTEVGCHFHLQGTLLIQGSNLHLLCLLH